MDTDTPHGDAPQPEHVALCEELARMVAEEEAQPEAFNLLHTDRMKQIIDDIGWPTISMVGRNGAYDAWLLVQQSDHDPEFQARCLDLMQDCPADEVGLRLIGYLEDRVRANAGKPQLYGTQFQAGADGRPEPWPIESPEHLDARREAIGMEPFEDYRRKVEGG